MDDATNGNKLQQLSVKQENAIDLLVTGKTDAVVAEQVGIHRTTVTKWRNYHPAFQAELNRRRQNVWATSAERLRALLPKAIDVIENEMADGENKFRAAAQIVKLAGLEDIGAPTGLDDAGKIVNERVLERVKEIRADRHRHLPVLAQLLAIDEPPTPEQAEADTAQAHREVLEDLELRIGGQD